MPQPPRVVVLMLGYNDGRHLADAIDSVLQQTYGRYELIVIDNASQDGSVALVRSRYPALRVIDNPANLGYARAYKEALRVFLGDEGFDAAVLLNADVVVSPGWLEALVRSAYASDDIAFAQPKVLLWDGAATDRINSYGNRVNYLGFGFCGHYNNRDSPAFSDDRDVAYASGCSLMVKRQPYFNVGELDDSFFAYYEDQDLCWRGRMMGYRAVVSAQSVMWHKYRFHAGTRNHLKTYLLERNRLSFVFKNYAARTLVLIAPMFILMEVGILVDAALHGYLCDKLRSYGSFLRNLPTLRASRRTCQSRRTRTDRELLPWFSPTLELEEIDSFGLRAANRLLSAYFALVRRLI